MPQRDRHDHALLLLSKARADKLVLDKLADDQEVADDVIGFHAQQAVEKLLKAALADREVDYPRVHDLDRLVDLLEANDIPLPPHARQLDELTPWATQLRYDELLDVERLDRERTSRQVAEVLKWSSAELDHPHPPPDAPDSKPATSESEGQNKTPDEAGSP